MAAREVADLGKWIAGGAFVLATSGCDRPPAPVAGGDIERGERLIISMGCAECHDVGRHGASRPIGPSLLHVRELPSIAGGLPNTPENMMAWITDPSSISSNSAMPNLGVTLEQARDMAAYLYSRD